MYTENQIKTVWTKAFAQLNYDSEHIRKDRCGALMVFEEYGNRDSKYGWEIDHIIPVSKGGTDDIGNLQPLHLRIPVDIRSLIPVISVHSISNLQYRWQS